MNNQSPSVPTEDVVDMSPFKRMVMTIGTLPTSFTESLTYYEALAFFVQELNKLIGVVDQNAEATKELQTLFVELKQYVDNYFTDLNVQEQINNKLDDMAESGELAGIIAQFLETAPVFAFATISAMAGSTNLSDGCIAKVLGKTDADDGDGSFYRIRTKVEGDTPDGINLVGFTNDDTIVAQIIPNAFYNELKTRLDHMEINVKDHGVVGDGVTDDTAAIQDLIDNNPQRVIYFPTGTYLISEPLVISGDNDYHVDFRCETDAIFKTDTEIDELLYITSPPNSVDYRELKRRFIRGGTWDCRNTTYGIRVGSASQLTAFEDNNLIWVENTGLYLEKSENHHGSGDHLINNICISGVSSLAASEPVGILCESYDNEFNNVRVQGCTVAMHITGAGCVVYNFHPLYIANAVPTKSGYEKTYAVIIDSPSGSFNKFYNFYNDSLCTGIKINSICQTYVTGGYMNTYVNPSDVEGMDTQMFWITVQNAQLYLENCRFDPTDGNITAHNIRYSTVTSDGLSRNFVQCKNCNWNVKSYIPDCDLSYGMKTNGLMSTIYTPYYAHTMTVDRYYKIGVVKTSQCATRFNLDLGSDGLVSVNIRWAGGSASSNATITKSVIETLQHGYTLSLCDEFSVNNERYAYLCLKATTSNTALNAGFLNFSGGGTCELITGYEKWGTSGFTPTVVNEEITL